MSSMISEDEWVGAALAAARDVFRLSLACSAVSVVRREREPPDGLSGAYLPLVSAEDQLYLAVLATDAICVAWARDMLGLGASQACSRVDVTDAIGEVANMVAGGLQRRIQRALPDLRLGLPVFVGGPVQAPAGSLRFALHLQVGADECVIVVIRRAGR
jgi:hypothetical protein